MLDKLIDFEKFPSVLKKALKDGLVSLDKEGVEKKFLSRKLIRGIRRCRTCEDMGELCECDFYSQAELLNLANSIANEYDFEHKPDGMSKVLYDHLCFVKKNKRFKNPDYRELGLYSCSLSTDVDKLKSMLGTSQKWFFAEGVVEDKHGCIMVDETYEHHVHLFAYSDVSLEKCFMEKHGDGCSKN